MHAYDHGFTYENVGAPVIIGDGLFGEHDVQIEINQKMCKYAHVAGVARAANAIVSISHVTGHPGYGTGGYFEEYWHGAFVSRWKTCATLRGHSSDTEQKCTVCGVCNKWCPVGAINMGDKFAIIDPKLCIGCGECLAVCRFDAVKIAWDESTVNLQKKIAEHCLAILQGKRGKVVFLIS